jgi:hypothetical protein
LSLLRERSPLFQAGQIAKPLLIAQGANDPRVKRAEADHMVKALKEKGIPVAYLLYPDGGHGFARPANNIAFCAVAENFLARHLGGPAEPIRPEELTKSTIEVKEVRPSFPCYNKPLRRLGTVIIPVLPALMQPEFAFERFDLGRLDQFRMSHHNAMQRPVELFPPERQEFDQDGKIRRKVVVLPDIGLQQARVIRQMIENTRGGKPISRELLDKIR